MRGEWSRGWRAGSAAIIGTSLGYGLWMAVSSLFVIPLHAEFGWSRGEIAKANIVGLFTGFGSPLVGYLVDRMGVRTVLTAGLALVAMSYVALSDLTASLHLYYVESFFMALFCLTTTGVTYSRIIVGTFSQTRGTALAFMRAGLAIATVIIPLVLLQVIGRFGTTGGYLLMAALDAFIALPLVLLFVPGKGKMIEEQSAPHAPRHAGYWRLLVEHPKIAIICLAVMLHAAPIVAIMTQIQPLGISKGLSPAAAAGGVSALGLALVVGALVAGFFMDRVWAPAVAYVMCVVPATGCLALAMIGNHLTPGIFYMLIASLGLGMGAEADTLGYIIVRYFGLAAYATIAGLAGLCLAIGIAIASAFIGHSYDLSGNYTFALVGAAIILMLAGFVYLMMGKYPDPAIMRGLDNNDRNNHGADPSGIECDRPTI